MVWVVDGWAAVAEEGGRNAVATGKGDSVSRVTGSKTSDGLVVMGVWMWA